MGTRDDLQSLIARVRALGYKVSTNVVSGHNVTAPDGTEARFARTRQTYRGQPTPHRERLRAHLLAILGDAEVTTWLDRVDQGPEDPEAMTDAELGDWWASAALGLAAAVRRMRGE